jgi:adenylate kinase family enzyme
VRRRLATYAAFAGPLIDFYTARATFATIDGLQRPDIVTRDRCAHIDRCRR